MKKLIPISLLAITLFACVDMKKEQNKQSLPIPINEPQKGWQRVKIADVGSIDLPPEMEIQGEEYKAMTKELNSMQSKLYDIEISESELIFQPKGVNSLDKDSLSKYARVLYETATSNPGDYQKLSEGITVTDAELLELNKELKLQFTEGFKKTPIRIIEWYPIQIVEVNGMSALLISYKRQLGDKPYVHVESYKFFDYDKMHSLTLSYRIIEKEIWEHQLNSILKSFRITKFN